MLILWWPVFAWGIFFLCQEFQKVTIFNNHKSYRYLKKINLLCIFSTDSWIIKKLLKSVLKYRHNWFCTLCDNSIFLYNKNYFIQLFKKKYYSVLIFLHPVQVYLNKKNHHRNLVVALTNKFWWTHILKHLWWLLKI